MDHITDLDLDTRAGTILFFEALVGAQITRVRVEGEQIHLYAVRGASDLFITLDLPEEFSDE